MKRYWFGLFAFSLVCVTAIWAQTPPEFKGHDGLINAVAISKDGATLGQDGSIRFWNPKDGKTIKELPKAHAGGVGMVAFSPSGQFLASGGGDKGVKLWDVKEAKELKVLGTHKGSVYSVAFNKDGT